MIDGVLGMLWILFIVIIGMCAVDLIGRVFDRLLKTKWERRSPRRVLNQISLRD